MVERLAVVMLAICPLGCFIPKDIEIDDFTGTGDFPWTDTLPATITVSTSIDTIESITATDSATSTTSGHHPSDTSSDGGTETETDTEGPESACNPQPEDVEAGVLVDGMPSWEHDHTELEVSCVVTWVGSLGPALHLGLACDDGAHTIDVSDIGGFDVVAGDIVDLSLYIDVPFWANVYVALRKDGEIVLAAVDADSLPGEEDDDGHPPHDFFAPLDLVVLHEVCPEEPEDPEPCNFVCHGCTRDRRLAIAFVDDGEAEVVFDHGTGQAGDLAIVVGHAVEHVEISCTDIPGWRFGFVALRG
jgi:hypothetical protein